MHTRRSMIQLSALLGSACSIIGAQSPLSKNVRSAAEVNLWQLIQKALMAANAEQTFDANFKDALIPGGAGGVAAFHGKVISSDPESGPWRLVVAVDGQDKPEVTLQMVEGYLREPVAPGALIAFKGVVRDFTKSPFMLWLEIEASDVQINPAH
jgi:hypothetical protein